MIHVSLFLPSIVPSVLAVMLAIHHFVIHRDGNKEENKKAHGESCAPVCYLQPSDVSNHETWIVALLSAAFTWGVAV